jgi:hypothetical protein
MFLDAIVIGPAALGLVLLATWVRVLTLRAERDGELFAPETESAERRLERALEELAKA